MKQEYKITFNDSEVFFFAHSFKSAYQHAKDFMERNKGKFSMKLYKFNDDTFNLFKTNDNVFGSKWILIDTI